MSTLWNCQEKNILLLELGLWQMVRVKSTVAAVTLFPSRRTLCVYTRRRCAATGDLGRPAGGGGGEDSKHLVRGCQDAASHPGQEGVRLREGNEGSCPLWGVRSTGTAAVACANSHWSLMREAQSWRINMHFYGNLMLLQYPSVRSSVLVIPLCCILQKHWSVAD